ncbi:MarR family winged helix-turn-helix transcriptional regulator [Acetobacter pasteurianus]|uniref:MarR family winged helix-turn-helix transcriptional regulator n=1 Tax=Acetobacter pasteurianus TaxID=438 RepID=UPI001F211209|nr:MarR family winged helix-turn-helix transcriptional regulator [Acetobacter pasteurianus]QHM91853.2 MarR family winged helix-turn-helix transcriptional regulator [Acetobacter pasteurianus]
MVKSRSGKVWRQADPKDQLFSSDASPFFHLTRLVSLYQIRMDAHLKPIGMDIPRWRVLAILHEHEYAPIGRIADLAVIRISTMTKLIYRMENEDLISTSVSEHDARVTDVRLTEKGMQVFTEVRAIASLIFGRAFHNFDDHEIRTLINTCSKIYQNIY